MKIQFIIVGWHYDTSVAGENYIEGLIELLKINDNVSIFNIFSRREITKETLKDIYDFFLRIVKFV